MIEIIESDLLFVSPVAGRHCHASPVGQNYIRPAGCCPVECPSAEPKRGVVQDQLTCAERQRLPLHDERWDAAEKYGSVGWHTFRHTYRSWLDETGAPMGVQQKLVRLDHDKRVWQRADGSNGKLTRPSFAEY